MQISVDELRTQTREIIARVQGGEEVVVADDGQAIVRLLSADPGKRPLGMDRGRGWVANDFDEPLPEEVQRTFEGR